MIRIRESNEPSLHLNHKSPPPPKQITESIWHTLQTAPRLHHPFGFRLSPEWRGDTALTDFYKGLA